MFIYRDKNESKMVLKTFYQVTGQLFELKIQKRLICAWKRKALCIVAAKASLYPFPILHYNIVCLTDEPVIMKIRSHFDSKLYLIRGKVRHPFEVKRAHYKVNQTPIKLMSMGLLISPKTKWSPDELHALSSI